MHRKFELLWGEGWLLMGSVFVKMRFVIMNSRPSSQPVVEADLDARHAGGLEVAVASPAHHGVLRDTFRLLSMTLLFSAAVAVTSASMGWPRLGIWLTLGGFFGLLMLTSALRNSIWGLAAVFALTGFMGYSLGPVLDAYLALANGPALIATATGVTGLAFFGLSFYARSAAAPDMSRYGTFLFVGMLALLGLSVAAYVFSLSMLALAVSAMAVMLMCGLILFEVQRIVRGGETNYIMATVTLFVAVFNLFSSLLHLLGFFAGEEG